MLEEKVEVLSQQLAEKKKADEVTEYERMKREAKDEAVKGVGVNVDILHQKLIMLESLAGKVERVRRLKCPLILSRFQVNKANPIFAASLVLKLLSSKEEEAILDKESRLMKQFGMSMAPPHPSSMDPMFGAAPYGAPAFPQWRRPYTAPPPRFPPARFQSVLSL